MREGRNTKWGVLSQVSSTHWNFTIECLIALFYRSNRDQHSFISSVSIWNTVTNPAANIHRLRFNQSKLYFTRVSWALISVQVIWDEKQWWRKFPWWYGFVFISTVFVPNKDVFWQKYEQTYTAEKNQESWGNCVMIELGLTYSRYFVGAQQGFEMLICKH